MQLTFDVAQQEAIDFTSFYPGENAELITALKQQSNGQIIYCWGKRGVGLSHLLQAACHEASLYHRTALYLPLKEMIVYGPNILQGLESLDLICIDDVDTIAGDKHWEEELFHCFNRLRDANKNIVCASHYSLNECPIGLADLRSRLSWGATYQVKPLNDDDLVKALQVYAVTQGFELSDEVSHYLLHHYPREIVGLKSILQKLAQASLTYKHKITVPFVKKVLDC